MITQWSVWTLYDELDAAVARAYGWDPGLPEEEILQNLVDATDPCHPSCR